MSDVLIGKANYGKGTGGGGFFFIEDNKPNVYRVLPPIKGMAPTGKVAKYYNVHRGIRGTDGKQKPFICVEKSDYKTKIISTHCALCDRVRELKEQIKIAESKGATKEQIKEANAKQVFPLQNEGKWYLNVINQDGKIGVLNIGSKMYNSFQALAEKLEKQGYDVSGMDGMFLNFTKTTKYKGDKDAVLQVEPATVSSGNGSFSYHMHTLTPDIINRLGKEAADLSKLFKELEPEQVSMIVQLQGDERAKYVDTLFNAPEREESKVTQTVAGTNAQLVTRVEMDQNGGLILQSPTVSAQPTQQSAPIVQQVVQQQTAPVVNANTIQQDIVQQTQAAPIFQQPTGGAPKSAAAFSDDEFMAMMTKKG